jgi:hypothetical protein
VSGLDSELHGAVRVRTVPHLMPEAKAAVARFGWSSHGLVIRRGREILYTAGDHRANGYDAHVALREALGLPLDCR